MVWAGLQSQDQNCRRQILMIFAGQRTGTVLKGSGWRRVRPRSRCRLGRDVPQDVLLRVLSRVCFSQLHLLGFTHGAPKIVLLIRHLGMLRPMGCASMCTEFHEFLNVVHPIWACLCRLSRAAFRGCAVKKHTHTHTHVAGSWVFLQQFLDWDARGNPKRNQPPEVLSRCHPLP